MPVISRANLKVIQDTVNFLETTDLVFLCDDGVYKHPEGIQAGMKEINQAISSMEVMPMSKKCKELVEFLNNDVTFA